MDTDYGRLYVAMAEKFLGRTDTVAPPSGCVAIELRFRVRSGCTDDLAPRSGVRCKAGTIR